MKRRGTNPIPFLSEQWQQLVRHAKAEADRLGLGCDFTVHSSFCLPYPSLSCFFREIDMNNPLAV
jgi:hypothetical protein